MCDWSYRKEHRRRGGEGGANNPKNLHEDTGKKKGGIFTILHSCSKGKDRVAHRLFDKSRPSHGSYHRVLERERLVLFRYGP